MGKVIMATFTRFLALLILSSKLSYALTFTLVNSVNPETGKPIEKQKQIISAKFLKTNVKGTTLVLYFDHPDEKRKKSSRFNLLNFYTKDDAMTFKQIVANPAYTAYDVYLSMDSDRRVKLGDRSAFPTFHYRSAIYHMRKSGEVISAKCEHPEDVKEYKMIPHGRYQCPYCNILRKRNWFFFRDLGWRNDGREIQRGNLFTWLKWAEKNLEI